MRICIRSDPTNGRSLKIGTALESGARKMGWTTEVVTEFHMAPRADMIAAYGWSTEPIFRSYRAAGLSFIYVDLGYWGRKSHKTDCDGYHKVVVNARHATGYFKRGRPHDRLAGSPRVMPWRRQGKHIVLAGLSAKGALSLGFQPLEWELKTIAAIRTVTDRPILYRPKPSWKQAQPIDGVGYSPRTASIASALTDAWALVTHQSNAAIDALAAGIPHYSEAGVASVLSLSSLADIAEASPPTGDRQQLLADIGYCHWTRPEIANGTMFRQLADEGLVPA